MSFGTGMSGTDDPSDDEGKPDAGQWLLRDAGQDDRRVGSYAVGTRRGSTKSVPNTRSQKLVVTPKLLGIGA